MLKDLFEKGKCALGFHIGDWRYLQDGSCQQTRVCSRCGETGTERRTVHDWGAWHPSQFYDTPVRVCRRCAEMVFKFDHESDQTDQVSLKMIDRAVWNVMEAKDSASVRERLLQNKEVLFNPIAEKYFEFDIDQRAPDKNAKDTFRQLAGLIERCRSEGIEAVFTPPATPQSPTYASPSSSVSPARGPSASAAGERDVRLLGHWRHTEAPASGGFSMAIDTHCVLDSSGRFEWWSKSMSSFGPSTSGPENGNWPASANTLHLTFDQGTTLAREYVLKDTTMFWPGDGRYRIWQRIS